jgi:transposase
MKEVADYVRLSARLRAAMAPHLVDLLKAGMSVVLDYPANTLANRAWMKGIADEAGAAHRLHWLDVPDSVCKARMRARNAAGDHEFAPTDEQFDLITSYFVPPSAKEGLEIVVHRPAATSGPYSITLRWLAIADSRLPVGVEAAMAKQLTWLSDAEWGRIEPLLPRGRKGAHRVDDRRVISGIVHMLRIGARWRDCPTEYGPYTTIYNRFNRWSRQGVWFEIFEVLTGHSGVWGTVAIDATHIKAHRSAGGAKGGPSRKPSAPPAADAPASSTV